MEKISQKANELEDNPDQQTVKTDLIHLRPVVSLKTPTGLV